MWYYVDVVSKSESAHMELLNYVRDKKPLNKFPNLNIRDLTSVVVLSHEEFAGDHFAVIVESAENPITETVGAMCSTGDYDITVRNVLGKVVCEYYADKDVVTSNKIPNDRFTITLSSSCIRFMLALYGELDGINDLRSLGTAYFSTKEYKDLWDAHKMGEVFIEDVNSDNDTTIFLTVRCSLDDGMTAVRAISSTFGVAASLFKLGSSVLLRQEEEIPVITKTLEEMLPQ